MDFLNRFRNLARRVGLTGAARDEQATEQTARDWAIVDKFAETVAENSNSSKDDVWKALYTGNPHASLLRNNSSPKFESRQEDMPDFDENFMNWITSHPRDFVTMIACLASAPTAIAITPALLSVLGFAPVDIVTIVCSHCEAPASFEPIVAESAFAILASACIRGVGLPVVQAMAASEAIQGICVPAAASFLASMRGDVCGRDDEK
ncbi:hypothetical protein FB567DRAFT_546703 [Paraphoma chrysanthemicola]|uniref:Uncharacterized protein n=1 Tax=Paraphoma chrysanthemicola TaxID=798071 RepID=A0A8K0R933_9PLEO|nr:hypothetical protein FB567DRAFT_546703 [Paraphoma chrysanthemicola]